MKKKIIITTSIIVSLLVVVSVGLYFVLNKKTEKAPSKVETVETYTIKFDSNGGSKIEDQKINRGEVLTLPAVPTKEGYIFVKWEDKDGNEISNGVLIKENLTLIASWKKLDNESKNDKKTIENTSKTSSKNVNKPKSKSTTTTPAAKTETKSETKSGGGS